MIDSAYIRLPFPLPGATFTLKDFITYALHLLFRFLCKDPEILL